MPSKPPDVKFARVLAREGSKRGTLSIVIDGKTYEFPISRKRVLCLLASAAEAAVDMKD